MDLIGTRALYHDVQCIPRLLLVTRRRKPICDRAFCLPKKNRITAPLFMGSLVFGAGWGLSGLFPGPAITSIATGSLSIIVFLGALTAGMFLFRWYDGGHCPGSSSYPSTVRARHLPIDQRPLFHQISEPPRADV